MTEHTKTDGLGEPAVAAPANPEAWRAAPRNARYLRLRFAETALPTPRLAIAGIGGFTAKR